MARQQEQHSVCTSCGASVYPEHLDSGIARYEGGKLMCPHCVVEYEKAHEGEDLDDPDLAPIAFDEDDSSGTRIDLGGTRIQTTAAESMLGYQGAWDDSKWNRQPDPKQAGAIRCRIFHSKLSEAALGFMNNSINEWLDTNPNVVVKSASTTIGQFEGKHTEPNIIVTIFY
ncbi:MAG: hypothetical protein J5J06_05040 [Phycisphaerae bacterium]|nr:hypothetical protein [Phycisphaerae bacterium]